MDSELILNHNKLNKVGKTTYISLNQMRLVTALIIGCILLAYSFLFLDNNMESDASTLTKVAAVVYFLAIMIIGFSTRAFDAKSLFLLICACVYMAINYLRFGVGIKNDIISICVIALFIIMRRISIDRKYAKYILLSLVVPFILIVIIGRPVTDGYIVSNLFANMYINPNTMSQLLFVNIFAILMLIGKKKFGIAHFFVFVVGFILAYLYSSRTALICLAVVLIGLLLANSRIKPNFIFRLFIVILLCSFAIVILYAYWLPTIVSTDFVIFGKKLFTGRQWIYSGVIDYIMTSPITFLFGYGHTSFHASNGILLNAHNYWLQLWLQYGLVFMFPVMITFIKTVKYIVKKSDKSSAKLFLTYCLCIVLFCMFEAPFTGRTMSIIFLMPLLIIKNFAYQKNTTQSGC